MLNKIIDLFGDQRIPFYFIQNYLQKKQYKQLIGNATIDSAAQVKVALSFDIEYDFGSPTIGTDKYVHPFLEKIPEIIDRCNAKPTFFMQANLVYKNVDPLRRAHKEGYELGLHCYAHEPWGNGWFIKDRTPSKNEREKLMAMCLKEFEKSNIPGPVSFRAPYMSLDDDGKDIIEKNGFLIDSSYPSYRSPGIGIRREKNLVEIPVSSDPLADFSFPKGSSFSVLNLRNLVTQGKEKMTARCENIVKLQVAMEKQPLLVFLAHPWEFARCDNSGIYSESNYEKLDEFIGSLSDKFRIKFTTMKELAGYGNA